MHNGREATNQRRALETPQRNHFFHGKMMDVYHFDLETTYLNVQRRRLTRMIAGWGVVCGLNVEPGRERNSITLTPGLAIDGWGREIVVPQQTRPISVPQWRIDEAVEMVDNRCAEACVQVVLCYRECYAEPAPVLAGDCNSPDPCAPGAVREQYEIEFRSGCAPPRAADCEESQIVSGGRLDYEALVNWISDTRTCRWTAEPCIPLANLGIWENDGRYQLDPNGIDIAIRPIVYTNAVLAEILRCLLQRGTRHYDQD